MAQRVLIIDDDVKLNDLLGRYLGKYEYTVVSALTPKDGLKILKDSPPDIVILDVMLPEMDGFAVCREIRKSSSVPVIMLTARGEVTDRVVGLEMGADDYLPKPFEPRELVARMQSILRRSMPHRPPSAQYGALGISFESHSASLNGTPLDLTTLEFMLLSLLARNPGVVLEREAIFERLKGYDDEALDRSIDVLISRLRSKLDDDPKHPKFIKTIWGTGYTFIG